MGGLRGGDRPTGQQIAAHLKSAFRALPAGVKKILARADAGFYPAFSNLMFDIPTFQRP